MAQSATPANVQNSRSQLYTVTARSERRLRQISAWLVLYLLLQGELGLAWDRQWHDYIGRDQFWIPPHIMLYTGLGGAGIIALIIVLTETFRYHRGTSDVNDSSTVHFLRYFHAPLGFTLLGFGALIDLLAAPFDNYWHTLYGIDVTLWSPFHIMGTIGGVLAGLGAVYAFASEAAHERQTATRRRFLGFSGPEWGTMILLAAFMELVLPALTTFELVTLGPLQFVSYGLPLACTAAACLVSAIQITRKPGAAIVTALIVCILALVTQLYTPWALREAVSLLDITFRNAQKTPVFNIALLVQCLIYLFCAVLLDSVAFWQRRQRQQQQLRTTRGLLHSTWLLGMCIALITTFVPPLLVQAMVVLVPHLVMPVDVSRTLIVEVSWSSLLLALPPALLIGSLCAMLGDTIGDIWYLNKR